MTLFRNYMLYVAYVILDTIPDRFSKPVRYLDLNFTKIANFIPLSILTTQSR